MITSLHIENIAVVKCADLDLKSGFTALTGETGAGKSIILDSINMLTGGKCSRELIRTGEDKATVSALFEDILPQNREALTAFGVDLGEDASFMLSRSITQDGKSQIRLNGQSVSAALVREICPLLLNIHGQHENQNLLKPSKHILYLDRYAASEKLLEEYQSIYEEVTSLRHRLEAINRDEKEKTRTIELLKYQIADIDSAHLKPGEEEQLEQKKLRIRNMEKTSKAAKLIYRALYRNEKGVSAFDLIERAVTAMNSLEGILPGADGYAERLDTMRYELEDIALTADALTSGDAELLGGASAAAALDRIEGRLDTIAKLCRKYGSDIAEILAYRAHAAGELEEIELSDVRIQELTRELDAATERLHRSAERLTACRRAAADDLETRVGRELAFLEMGKVQFHVDIQPKEPGGDGMDGVEFMISTNPGDPLKPLAKIASGGEMSRIMLAIKCVLAGKESTETLIFDEIDTGVSGLTSHKIGVKLREIADTAQVLCVTHSAQIAAVAGHHLRIEKHEVGGRAETTVRELNEEERVQEIARIMGGAEITPALLETASEMLRG